MPLTKAQVRRYRTAANLASHNRERLYLSGRACVAVITDLLEQGVPLEDVQHLAGHADLRTTRLYDRRQSKVTRNIVDRISI
jgi:site-specific recombinase XerD